jgi:hypothetical protein
LASNPPQLVNLIVLEIASFLAMTSSNKQKRYHQTAYMKKIFILTLLSTCILNAQKPKPKSQWVYENNNGKLIYKTTPTGDKIMDFSYAGYMGGGVALPIVPVKVMVKPSGEKDDTKTIQAAIDEVALMPCKMALEEQYYYLPEHSLALAHLP